MNRFRLGIGPALAILLAAAPGAWAQQWRRPPQIGYVYPAGGRQGKTFEVTVGGQYLSDAAEVHLSGQGLQANVVDYTRPPTGKEIATVREILQQAQKKLRAEAKDGKAPRRLAIRQLFVSMAKEKGITDKQIEAFDQFRKQRSDPKRQLNPQLSEWVKVRVTVAANAKPGTRELRLATKNGLSNPLRFCVGRLRECRESEPNNQAPAATPVPSLPIILNGQITPGDVDRFRFHAGRGQRLVINVSARDLIPYLADAVPGWFQATVALYDDTGRELAYADDYRFDPDPVLLYQVPRDGDYVLEIRDSIYRGREDFVYRIALGQLPFVSDVFPMGARRAEKTAVAIEGWNLPLGQLALDVSFADTGLQPFRLPGATEACNSVLFAVDDLPERREKEPNDDASTAAKVTLPLIVNGRIDRAGDWDVFRFHARKGEQIVAEVQARRLGSPLDSLLRLTDADGQVLARNDDHEDKGAGLVTHHADSVLSVTIPATGDCLLWLGDTQRRGGRAYAYRLRISPARADFELRVAPSAVNAAGGMTVPITVYALRRDGFAGDIALRLKDAPEGFKLSGWLPAGQDKARLTLTVPSKPEQKLTALHLEGYATVDGREIARQAVPADDMTQAFVYHHLVPAEAWMAAVAPIGWNRPPWTVVAERPVLLKPGGTARIRVQTGRRVPAGQVRLQLSDPPEGIAIQKVTPVARGFSVVISADADKVKPHLKGNLIINAVLERKPPAKDGQPQAKVRRIPLGVLPAVPFEVVGGQ